MASKIKVITSNTITVEPQRSVRIGDELWDPAMKKARSESDMTLSQVIRLLLEGYVEGQIEVRRPRTDFEEGVILGEACTHSRVFTTGSQHGRCKDCNAQVTPHALAGDEQPCAHPKVFKTGKRKGQCTACKKYVE